jgi:hypothetical protein
MPARSRVLPIACLASLTLSLSAHAADRPAGALPAPKFRERFALFQPAPVKQAMRAAKAFGKLDIINQRDHALKHDQVLIEAANEGLKNGSLSIRSLIYLARKTGLGSSQYNIVQRIAKEKGPALSFQEQKILVDKGNFSVSDAKQMAELLIDQHKADMTSRQAAKLRRIADPPTVPISSSSLGTGLSLGLATGMMLNSNNMLLNSINNSR